MIHGYQILQLFSIVHRTNPPWLVLIGSSEAESPLIFEGHSFDPELAVLAELAARYLSKIGPSLSKGSEMDSEGSI